MQYAVGSLACKHLDGKQKILKTNPNNLKPQMQTKKLCIKHRAS